MLTSLQTLQPFEQSGHFSLGGTTSDLVSMHAIHQNCTCIHRSFYETWQ